MKYDKIIFGQYNLLPLIISVVTTILNNQMHPDCKQFLKEKA